MATNKITTSIVVDFAAGKEDGILKAEIDDREEGLNLGVTSFLPGDSPAFLVFKSSNVTITGMSTSAGSLLTLSPGAKEVEEFIMFANEREASPSYPISGSFVGKWIGNQGGVITQRENKILVPTPVVASLKVNFSSTFQAYQLINVPTTLDGETSFSVVIYIAGTYTS